MNKRIFLLAGALLFSFSILLAQHGSNNADEAICKHILAELQQHSEKSTAELVVFAGKLLMNTPYVAHTLETEPEQLIFKKYLCEKLKILRRNQQCARLNIMRNSNNLRI
ncbi:hypothetical protein SAMN05444285_12619 [Draconibacterium orientale]|uniref:Uncharacterized protein n=1 Tax=Draconibacterium orientale TaxID=1168034 RepID=X5E480_9BACT|nr:hypothetical protein [Draconibacterium orientale]AHW62265.1 hypothetical protein FH5T_18575 [Draconibacterium orientale]SET86282.1 hypothetical protein SAMN05444285_12619 [Draconibacterium orientale]